MLELAHSTFAHIGLAGLAGLWVVKAAAGYVGLRWLRERRLGTKGTRG
ncbi:hypothetical protein [Ruegeria aquimaris]|nr:hypothetical protein [Ruegeria sp. XHP0148]